MQSNNEGQERWAIILAGGEGRRLSSLTQRIAGDARPKQFCLVIGDSSLIEQTLGRVSMSVADERTLVVVLRAHEQYYKPLLGDMRRQNLVIQPENRGTATAILCSLLRLSKLDPCGIRSVVSLRSLCERRAPFHAPSRFGLRRRAAAAGTDSLVRRCRRKRRDCVRMDRTRTAGGHGPRRHFRYPLFLGETTARIGPATSGPLLPME